MCGWVGAKPKVCTKRFIIKLKKKGEIGTKGVNGIKRVKKREKKRSTRCILLNVN